MLPFLTSEFQNQSDARTICGPCGAADMIQECDGCDTECFTNCLAVCASQCHETSQESCDGSGGSSPLCHHECTTSCVSMVSLFFGK